MNQAPEKHLIAVASNPAQMQLAQQDLIVWMDTRLTTLDTELAEASANLEQAKKHKWKSSPFLKQVNKLKDQQLFYGKVRSALAAGYTIIPNFQDVDVFAIRTTAARPSPNTEKSKWSKPFPVDQTAEILPIGEGSFVNASANFGRKKLVEGQDDKGKDQWVHIAETTSHALVDFPFKLVKPEIMISTKQAMDCLVFDDMVCSPSRNRPTRGDPMIIGRIHLGSRSSAPIRTLSFLVTWFISTKDL